MRTLQLAVIGALLMTTGVPAQPASQRLSFEVVSIKRNAGIETRQNSRILPGGRIEVTNMPLRTLIRIAYGSTGAQIEGGPAWVASDGYDIVAKAPGDLTLDAGRGPSPQLMAMLRTLLEDRFQLIVHTERRETQTYALVLAARDRRLGPQLQISTVDCATSNACGIRGANGDVTYSGLNMALIATSIAGFPAVRAPVADRTGLSDRYDLHLQFNDDAGPNIFTALVEQAGLKLQPEKGEAEFIVIDRASRPTDD